jgi:mono/diheme cytochrome c family protein
MMLPAVFLAALLALWAWAPATTVWKGVYTETQAERGQAQYTNACSGCHQPNLSGYGNLLVGEKFMDHWREDSVGSFYHVMKMTMPRGGPDSLGDPAYLDIMAFILQANGFPAGKTELTVKTLDSIRIEGQDGPKPVPEFALVKTVGCLVHDGPEWRVERASEPLRTRQPHDGAPEELKADAGLTGSDVVRFLRLADYDVERFKMQEKAGRKVEAKGFLILKNGAKTLNLTSVAAVASDCK